MNPETIIAELRRINAWRRGDETIEQPEPEHFGDVLDAAAILIEQTDARCIEREERIDQMGASWDKTKTDLARVTAERDEARAGRMELERFRDRYEPVRQSLIKQEAELAALRARVAELDESLHLTNGTADLALHHRDIAEQRNAELEAALLPLAMVAKYCGQIKDSTGVWSHTSIIDGEHFSLTIGDCRRARDTLARAESEKGGAA